MLCRVLHVLCEIAFEAFLFRHHPLDDQIAFSIGRTPSPFQVVMKVLSATKRFLVTAFCGVLAAFIKTYKKSVCRDGIYWL